MARSFERLGVLSLLERTLAHGPPMLTILTYHRIALPSANLFYDPVISATPDSFHAHVDWLSSRVRVLALDELIGAIDSDTPWREPVMLITFDDGYRDNFDVAAPILRERGIPATFFVPTAFFDSPRLPWWDHVAYVIKQTRVPRFTVERDDNGSLPPVTIDLQATSPTAAIMTLVRAFLDDTIGDERGFLDRLATAARVDVDTEDLGRSLFMNWDQVKQLADSNSGLTIGSHAHSHRKLAGLALDSQRDELVASKQILETRLGTSIRALAYPYGWPGAYSAQTRALAAEVGYCLAFSSREGVNRFGEFERFEMKRLGVGSADTATLLRARRALHGSFGKSIL